MTQEPALALQTYIARAMLDGLAGDELALVARKSYTLTHNKEPTGTELVNLLGQLRSASPMELMNAAGDFRWRPTTMWPPDQGNYGKFMDALSEVRSWAKKKDPQYISELPFMTNVRLRQFKENYRGMNAMQVINLIDDSGMAGYLNNIGDQVATAFGYLPEDAKAAALKWTQSAFPSGYLSSRRKLTWKFIAEQPKTKYYATWMMLTAFIGIYGGSPQAAAAVE